MSSGNVCSKKVYGGEIILEPTNLQRKEKKMNGKKTIKLIALTMAVFGLFGLGAVQAGSLNMTGTWEGFTACDELKGGEFTHDSFPELLKISQDGDMVRMEGFGILYEGKVQEITGSSIQGEAVLGACGGTPETETVRIQRIITKGTEGSFDATSVYESDDFFPGLRTFGTCKWHYKRVSTDDPMVSPCGDGN